MLVLIFVILLQSVDSFHFCEFHANTDIVLFVCCSSQCCGVELNKVHCGVNHRLQMEKWTTHKHQCNSQFLYFNRAATFISTCMLSCCINSACCFSSTACFCHVMHAVFESSHCLRVLVSYSVSCSPATAWTVLGVVFVYLFLKSDKKQINLCILESYFIPCLTWQ